MKAQGCVLHTRAISRCNETQEWLSLSLIGYRDWEITSRTDFICVISGRDEKSGVTTGRIGIQNEVNQVDQKKFSWLRGSLVVYRAFVTMGNDTQPPCVVFHSLSFS